jgi:hypothetical protein
MIAGTKICGVALVVLLESARMIQLTNLAQSGHAIRQPSELNNINLMSCFYDNYNIGFSRELSVIQNNRRLCYLLVMVNKHVESVPVCCEMTNKSKDIPVSAHERPLHRSLFAIRGVSL